MVTSGGRAQRRMAAHTQRCSVPKTRENLRFPPARNLLHFYRHFGLRFHRESIGSVPPEWDTNSRALLSTWTGAECKQRIVVLFLLEI
ncbi:hypothetical protein JTE90_014675 [Oedothorax gibbosus]|uniref:Uncharacterized protein n=1 Tax=Oedothorax gibbosus TaxID=931172 RepID=A0AAV6UIV1_9ARAC|nr:hypothetical protein JTE90_014675 [Oedothorax gibbosus]